MDPVRALVVTFFMSLSGLLLAAELPTGPRLKDLAGPMMIGSAYFADWYSDADREIILREHNATQAVVFGAYGAWLSPGVYEFSDFNRTINWAVANHKQVTMTVLAGNDVYMPEWMRSGGYTPAQLEALLDDFFRAIITANGNDTKVAMWNVINEVCNIDGNGFETSVLDALGWEDDASGLTGDEQRVTRFPVYIRRAFEIARKYTGRDLELRDHSIEMHMTGYTPNTIKPKMFYQLCRHLLAKGAPVTAVGIQGHVTVTPAWGENTWDSHAAWIRKLKGLGLKVYITENTVQPADVPLAADWDAYQKDKIYHMLKVGREAGIDGFFTWGLRCDADPSLYHRGFNSMPFTLAGDPRPMHYGMQQALSETPIAVNRAPTVSMSAQASAAVGGTVALSANANDPDGSIAQVEFFLGTTALSIDTTEPFVATWIPTAAGSFTMSARATDNLGAVTVSDLHSMIIVASGAGTGLTGIYHADMALANAVTTRTDPLVDFDWGNGSPITDMAADGFSVRWVGQVQAQFTETYTFSTRSDDGIRLWVNGQQLIDNWADHGPTENSGTIWLVAGEKYELRLEYYENGGGAVAQLSWASPSIAKQIIPMSQLFPRPPVGLPAGWTAQDIGSVAVAGSTAHEQGTWTVTGSGADIWGSADACNFTSIRVTGDVQLTAQVTGITNTNSWAKAGVMIRESLAAGSRHASTLATSGNGIAYQRRTTTGGSSSHTAGPGSAVPYWVRIERLGNVVISSASSNGATWTVIRRQTINLGATVYVGLAVTSHQDGQWCTGTFTNVHVVGVAAAAN